jgi:hypothetical protein
MIKTGMRKHVTEADLAVYAAGDMSCWTRPLIHLHVSRCAVCKGRAEAYRTDQQRIRELADELPPGLNWDRLAAEMHANIHVGLEAGECVAPRTGKRGIPAGWRVAAAIAGFSALLISAWWLNMPAAQTASLGRAMKAITHWQISSRGLRFEDSGPLVEATAAGIELRENGSALAVTHGVNSRPVAVSLSVQGSARARYIDSDTGQVTITSVYAQ